MPESESKTASVSRLVEKAEITVSDRMETNYGLFAARAGHLAVMTTAEL